MAFNSQISRTDAAALIPEEVSREIIQGVPEQSVVMRLARRLPNMARGQLRMPVLSGLVNAYFVNPGGGDTGLKQTSDAAWQNKYIYAEEIAAIVPIPEAVLDDADYDIWGEIKPKLLEAFGKTFDAAVLHGTDAPTDWPDDIATAAAAAANTVDLSTRTALGDDLYDTLLGENGVITTVEADGYNPTGWAAAVSMKGKLRGLRDSFGQPIFKRTATNGQNMQAATSYDIDGLPALFPMNGAISASAVLAFVGDWNQLVYSIRQDMTYKILTEGVIQDGSGNIVYNLAQQDMVALRAVMRLGWQVPNPINRMQETEASRYPFGILVP